MTHSPLAHAPRRAARITPAALLCGACAIAACARGAKPAAAPTPAPAPPAAARPAAPAFPFGGVGRVDTVASGIEHLAFTVPASGARGPWAVHVLRVRPECAIGALKAGRGAVGRATTSSLVDGAVIGEHVAAAGVNADFFTFAPPGVPLSAHVARGAVVTGPGVGASARPVFAAGVADALGRPAAATGVLPGGFYIGPLTTTGTLTLGGLPLRITSWNRSRRDGLAVFTEAQGFWTDSLRGRVFVTLRRLPGARPTNQVAVEARHPVEVVGVDTGVARFIPAGAEVVVAGPAVPRTVRARLLALRPGVDRGTLGYALGPVRPREAVGGYPVLLRGGAVTADVDTAGAASFRGVNPRTAVGVARDGALLLVTVDGRRPGHSAGTTLRETAELLRALGAADALNLDGGGSTAMAIRGADGRVAVVNRPSDAAGERPVANALAVGACPGR